MSVVLSELCSQAMVSDVSTSVVMPQFVTLSESCTSTVVYDALAVMCTSNMSLCGQIY